MGPVAIRARAPREIGGGDRALVIVASGGAGLALLPLPPIVAEQLHWMGRSNASVPTAEIVGRAILVASPADALRMLGMNRKCGRCERLCHSQLQSGARFPRLGCAAIQGKDNVIPRRGTEPALPRGRSSWRKPFFDFFNTEFHSHSDDPPAQMVRRGGNQCCDRSHKGFGSS